LSENDPKSSAEIAGKEFREFKNMEDQEYLLHLLIIVKSFLWLAPPLKNP
jgi:hypothetical protein